MEDDEKDKMEEELKSAEEAKINMEKDLLELQKEVQKLEDINNSHYENSDKLHRLFEAGIIDEEGMPVAKK